MNDLNYQHEVRGYLIGFGLALLLTLAAFVIAKWGHQGAVATLMVLGALGLIQLVVQLRFFLHIDLQRQKREDLQLILFSVLLLIIMAGGAIWIIGNLGMRMGDESICRAPPFSTYNLKMPSVEGETF